MTGAKRCAILLLYNQHAVADLKMDGRVLGQVLGWPPDVLSARYCEGIFQQHPIRLSVLPSSP